MNKKNQLYYDRYRIEEYRGCPRYFLAVVDQYSGQYHLDANLHLFAHKRHQNLKSFTEN